MLKKRPTDLGADLNPLKYNPVNLKLMGVLVFLYRTQCGMGVNELSLCRGELRAHEYLNA